MEERKKHGKRRVILVALAACLTVVAAGGVLAWFNVQSSLTNTFTVGNITDPDPENPDPTDPVKPIEPSDPNYDAKVNGNLYEPNWVPDSKIGPGAKVAKDPYVGIGKASDPAYVYVYVKNNFTGADKPYFAMEAGWEAVQATPAAAGAGYYTEGLFVYGTAAAPRELNPGAAPDNKDVWTDTPLFSHILTTDTFTSAKGSIEVHAYVAAKSSTGDSFLDLDEAAKAWVATI